MASKQDKFFFNNLIQAAESACKTADYLLSCLENYQPENSRAMVDEMHRYEHEGDQTLHRMTAALAKAFVTPVDREDLDLLSRNIDDVTDCVEDVLQTVYVNRVTRIPGEILEYARLICRACGVMRDMMVEFEHFKKPAKLHDLVIKLGDLEEEGDRLYLQYKYNIMKDCTDVLEIICWREILDKMENCLDACEHVGASVDTVVIKNT